MPLQGLFFNLITSALTKTATCSRVCKYPTRIKCILISDFSYNNSITNGLEVV